MLSKAWQGSAGISRALRSLSVHSRAEQGLAVARKARQRIAGQLERACFFSRKPWGERKRIVVQGRATSARASSAQAHIIQMERKRRGREAAPHHLSSLPPLTTCTRSCMRCGICLHKPPTSCWALTHVAAALGLLEPLLGCFHPLAADVQ